ncbi:DUF4011 domain-containing protein [Blastococcus sp. TML/C7B]|uniref:DUF4011 domain-containing protein n=1 Tax=Blastococcus sp. TML/C7B TaxID=2798728 RepID=UPI001F5B458A|nr:DUF4011 domain-containing protein [Blastococcus sp. TML/C7B]
MESTAESDLRDAVAPRTTAVSIEITSTPVLSYALAHNGIPVVPRLALTSESTVRGATVRLSVRDAEGPIARPVELLADLDAGRSTVLTDVGLVMDPAAMLQVEEQRPGVIDVEVWVDDVAEGGPVLAGEASRSVQVLAANQWLASPLPLALEMLAAHVTPNHPAVTALVAEAVDRLESTTGSGALVGYAATAERVDEVVTAIAETLRARGLRYSEPPATWSDVGQQVRTPGDVLTWKVGTPLDTVVLLAAALEQAGIRPLLWLAEGIGGREGGAHAFLGYWREERSAESAATTDPAGLVNLVDLGLIGLVETTLLTSMGEVGTDLHHPAYDGWLTGELDRIVGVTDVHRARRDGIVPLPARARDEAGVLQIVEYRAAVHSAPAPPEGTTATASAPKPDAPARVQQWKNALLDLSLRNRLINYTERTGLALTVPPSALPVLERFVHDGTPITLLPGDKLAAVQTERGLADAGDLPTAQLADLLVERREVHADVTTGGYLPRLRNLAYRAKTVQEETGANNLYLALGSLAWELDGRPLRSPLVLIPVTLTPLSRTGSYRLALDETGSTAPNYCLLEKLRQLHGLTVPTLTETADGTMDVEAALEALRVALVGHGLPYRVEATADLAVLQFAKYRLWKDLDEHWADFAENPLVAHLVHEPTEPFTDPALESGAYTDLDDLAAGLPVAADSSQLRAIAEADAGRTFVLEGPPGTGKSQTITNLLTRAVAQGKRVLFVAEKRAALDVVARRLDAVGMGMFALDLHDKGSRASMVRAQIRLALEHAVSVDEQGLAADSENLRSARRLLARYADRLHTENAAGLSLYTARTAELTAGTDVQPLPIPLPFVANAPAEVLTQVRRALALLPEIADLTRPSPRHPWAFVDSPSIDLPGRPGRGRRGRRGGARRRRAARADPGAAARPHAGGLRRARPPARRPGRRPGRPRRDLLPPLDDGDRRGAGRGRGVPRLPAPGHGAGRARGARPAAGRHLRGRADGGGVVLVGTPAAADRGARPARPAPAARRQGQAEGRPGAGREPVAGADRRAADRRPGRRAAGDDAARGLEPVRRPAAGRAPGGLAAPRRAGRRRLVHLPRAAAQADRGRHPGRRRDGVGGAPPARRGDRAAARRRCERRPTRRLGRRRRVHAALVDDPARARLRRSVGARRRRLGAHVAAPMGHLPRHPRAAALRRPVRRAAAAGHGRDHGRRRRPRAGPGAGRGLGDRAAGRDRAGPVRRGRAREGDRPLHRRLAGCARAPHLRAAGLGAGHPPLRRRGGRRPGRCAPARAGQAAPRAGRAAAARPVRRPDHRGHAVRAGLAGLGGPFLPGRRGAVRPGGLRRGLADPGGRRRRGPGAGEGRRRRR